MKIYSKSKIKLFSQISNIEQTLLEGYFKDRQFDFELMSLKNHREYFDFILTLKNYDKNKSIKELGQFLQNILVNNLLYSINYFQTHRYEPLLTLYICTCFPDEMYVESSFSDSFFEVDSDYVLEKKREKVVDYLVIKYSKKRYDETLESRLKNHKHGFDPDFDPLMEIYDYLIPRSGFQFIFSDEIRNDLLNLRERDSESHQQIAKKINDFYNRFEENTELRNWLIYILVNNLKPIVGVRGSFRIIPEILRKRFYASYKDTSIARIYYKKQKEYKKTFTSESELLEEINLKHELKIIEYYYPDELSKKVWEFKRVRRKNKIENNN